MRRSSSVLLASAALSLGGAGVVHAQAGWAPDPSGEGVSSVRLQGLPAGQIAQVTVFVAPPSPQPAEAWLDARADADARGAGGVVKASPARAGAAGGMTVVSATRIVREPEGLVARGYLLRRLPSGKGVLCRMRVTDDPQALPQLLGKAAAVCTAVLVKADAGSGGAPAGPVGASRPAPAPPRASANGPPPPAAAGRGLRPDQIAAVWFWFTTPHIQPFGGLVSDDATYLVLRDGTAYRGFERAPQDFDVAASRAQSPMKWGRWSGSGAGAVFTAANGRVDRLGKDGIVKPCRPAAPGETMDQMFSATSGGSIGFGATQSVTFSGSDLRFRRDGTLQMQSATAVGGANYGGGVSRGPGVVRYRLDGYTLTLTAPGGQSERRSYCRVEPGLIVVNGRRYFTPTR